MRMNMRSRGVTVVAGVLLIGLLGLVATVLENQGVSRSAQLAQTPAATLPAGFDGTGLPPSGPPQVYSTPASAPASANPKGSKTKKCTQTIKDPFTGKPKEVGLECWPSVSAGSVDDKCKPSTYLPAGKCKVHYCDISGKKCGIASQDTLPDSVTAPAGTKYENSWSWESGAKPLPYLNEYQQYLQAQYSGFGSITAGSWGGTGTFGDNPTSNGWQDTVSTAPGQPDAQYIPTIDDNPTLRSLEALADKQNLGADIQKKLDTLLPTNTDMAAWYPPGYDPTGTEKADIASTKDKLEELKKECSVGYYCYVDTATADSLGVKCGGDDNGKCVTTLGNIENRQMELQRQEDAKKNEADMANGWYPPGYDPTKTEKPTTEKPKDPNDPGMAAWYPPGYDPTKTEKPTTDKPRDPPNNPNDPNTRNRNDNNQGGPPNGQQQGSGSGLGNMLGSMLSGLTKALGGSGNNCGTSGQQQQQQQQQAYTYQTQITYVQDAYGQMIPIQQQVPVAVQQPASSQQCPPQSNSGTNANQCSPSYFCQGNNLMYRTNTCANQMVQTCQYGCSGVSCIPQGGTGGNNSAQISCSPSTADPGSIIAISFACTNNATSTAVGFDTGGASSGSAQAVTATSSTASNATYTLSCTAGGVTQSSSCTVTLNRPNIMVAATPKNVQSGGIASIGWVSTGMSSCGISSADLPDFTVANKDITSVSGLATTTALYATSTIDISCTILGGGTRTASVTIGVDQ